MRRCSWIAALALSYACPAVLAGTRPITFDFDALGPRDRSPEINSYMTSVYGSPVTVEGARTYAESFGSSDIFIGTSFQLFNRGDFIITFEDLPILGARFEGHVIDGTFGDDFTFTAFNGDAVVSTFTRNDGEELFDSGWLDFGAPVNRIQVTDSGRKDVGIDDFSVLPVPEPTTCLLLLIAAGATITRRRHP